MKWLTGLILAMSLSLPAEAMGPALGAKREELPPVPDNMCQLITIELLIAVEEGVITEEIAEQVGGRCFQIWGDYFRVYK